MGKKFIRRSEVISAIRVEWQECLDLVEDKEIDNDYLEERYDALFTVCHFLGIDWKKDLGFEEL